MKALQKCQAFLSKAPMNSSQTLSN